MAIVTVVGLPSRYTEIMIIISCLMLAYLPQFRLFPCVVELYLTHAPSQHYTKLRSQIMKLAAESTSTFTDGSPPPAAAAETSATPKRTRTGRSKQTDEQKAVVKGARKIKKAAGATPTKGDGRGKLFIAKEGLYEDHDDGTTKDEEDSDEPMMAKRNGDYSSGTAIKKRRMSSVVKKVEKVDINDPVESAGSGEMDISDSQ